MKIWNNLLNKFWFWVILVFIGNIIFNAYGLIQSNKEIKDNIFKGSSINSINLIPNTYNPEKTAILGKKYTKNVGSEKIISINVKSIIYSNNKLTVDINFPTGEELKNNFNKYLKFKVLNKSGEEIPIKQVDFISGSEPKFIITGEDLNSAIWLTIAPYTLEDNNTLIFHVMKKY